MKKVLVLSALVLALTLVLSASAEARCNISCLNHKTKALASGLIRAEKTIAAQNQTIARLGQKVSEQGQAITTQSSVINQQTQGLKQANAELSCLVEAPLTQYGEPEGPLGYLVQFENESDELETIATTALDVTYPEDSVGGWVLLDSCNHSKEPATASHSAIAPRTDLLDLLQPQALLP